MIDALILLAPLILLVIVVLFGFVGCGEPFTSRDTPPDQPPETPPTEPSEPYAKHIEATTGFLAPGLSGGVEDLPPEVSTSAPLFGVLSRACVRIHDLSSSRTARQTSVSARR